MLFVDRLFKALESESYLNGRESRTPSPSATPNPGSQAVAKQPIARPGPSVAGGNKSQTASATLLEQEVGGGGEKGKLGGGAGKRHADDPRSRDVCTFLVSHQEIFSA